VRGGSIVLSWVIAFLVLAVISGVLGFGVIAGTVAVIAQVLFFIFLALLIAVAGLGKTGGRHD